LTKTSVDDAYTTDGVSSSSPEATSSTLSTAGTGNGILEDDTHSATVGSKTGKLHNPDNDRMKTNYGKVHFHSMAADRRAEDSPKDSLSVQQGVAGGHEGPATLTQADSVPLLILRNLQTDTLHLCDFQYHGIPRLANMLQIG
jgi:hypothetical protein